jgi:acyl-CoA thioesterase I
MTLIRRGLAVGAASALVALLASCAAVAVPAAGSTGAGGAGSGAASEPSATPSPTTTALGAPKGSALPAAAPPATVPVVTIGDSIMAGFGLPSGQDWPTLLGAADGVTVTNLGCSGGGFIAVGSCGSDFEGLVSAAAAADPGVVIVEGSDNDGGQSAAALDKATTATVAAIHRAIPGALIVGLSTLWDQPSSAPAEISDSSAAVQTAVEAVGGTYVDIGQPLQGHTDLLQDDDEHPTVSGQQVLLADVSSALQVAGVAL